MSKSMPSLAALLGLVAVAGYQNRDKLGELFKSVTGGGQPTGAQPQASSGGFLNNMMPSGGNAGGGLGGLGGMLGGAGNSGGLGGLAGMLGGALAGGGLAGGLGQLVNQFKDHGLGDAAQSWVGTGANMPVSQNQLETALGPDLVDGLVQQTGLSREELLDRLATVLPEAVDTLTPNGRLPG